jgi:acetylxylan esterase
MSFNITLKFLFAAIIGFCFLPTASAAANQLVQVKNFGLNPTNISFYIYVPTKLQTKPPILVNPHWCHGNVQAAFTGTQLSTLADTYG